MAKGMERLNKDYITNGLDSLIKSIDDVNETDGYSIFQQNNIKKSIADCEAIIERLKGLESYYQNDIKKRLER